MAELIDVIVVDGVRVIKRTPIVQLPPMRINLTRDDIQVYHDTFEWGTTLALYLLDNPGATIEVPKGVKGPLRSWRQITLPGIVQLMQYSDDRDVLEEDFETIATAAGIKLRHAREQQFAAEKASRKQQT